MNQGAILGIAVPAVLAGIPLIWFLAVVAPELAMRLDGRALRVSVKLQLVAAEKLKTLRAVLNDVLEDYDAGHDPYLTRLNPESALQSVRDFYRVVTLEKSVRETIGRVAKRVRRGFWPAVMFVVLMIAGIVFAFLRDALGSYLASSICLVAAGVVLVLGCAYFLLVLRPYRVVQQAEIRATEEIALEPAASVSAEALDFDGEPDQ